MKKLVLLLAIISFMPLFAKENITIENQNDAKTVTKQYQNINWGPYMRDLETGIKRNWTPPKSDKTRRIVVGLSIAKDGKLLNHRIIKSSGTPLADRAAMEAVKQSSPFKPLPEEFKGKWVAIEFTFDYNVLNNPQSANYTHPDIIYLHSVYNPLAVKKQSKDNTVKQTDLIQEKLTKIERKYIPSYVNSVVESNWTPPENSCTKPTVISFKIKSDGSVIDKTIIESSGCGKNC